MTDKQDVKKKRLNAKESPVHTIQVGSVTALVWRRQSPSGFSYLDYSLIREYSSLSTGSFCYSKNFFASNNNDLVEVIQLASRWITEHDRPSIQQDSKAA